MIRCRFESYKNIVEICPRSEYLGAAYCNLNSYRSCFIGEYENESEICVKVPHGSKIYLYIS